MPSLHRHYSRGTCERCKRSFPSHMFTIVKSGAFLCPRCAHLIVYPYPVLFEAAPIGVAGAMEAVNTIFFCSEHCRDMYAERDSGGTLFKGESADWIDGTVCNLCSKAL